MAPIIRAAILSGVLAGLSQPLVIGVLGPAPIDPSGLSGLLAFIALIPVLLAIRGRSVRSAFGLGFLASWVQIVIIAHWVVIAFHVFAGIPLLLAIPGMLLVGAALGLITALGFAAGELSAARLGAPRWLAMPGAVTAAELLRNHLPFGGDPWGNLGMSMAGIDLLRQAASLVGVHGLVFLVVLINAILAELIHARRNHLRAPRWAMAAGALCVIAWTVWGAIRLAPSTAPSAKTLRIGLLQASIDQRWINRTEPPFEEMRREYQILQELALARGAEIVVWPEGALVPPLSEPLPPLDTVVTASHAVAPRIAVLGSTILHTEIFPPQTEPRIVVNNSALVTGPQLALLGRFDKRHLVPFGEYVPWPLSALLDRLVSSPAELRPGRIERPVMIPSSIGLLPIAVTICFESAFPEISRGQVEAGAELLFNVTNDAWYGISSAPVQHLQMMMMRATENGRAVARAANSGISALIDPRGRVIEASRLRDKTAVIGALPISAEQTLYTRSGDLLAIVALLVTTALSIAAFRRAPSSQSPTRVRSRLETTLLSAGAILLAGGLLGILRWPLAESTQTLTALMCSLVYASLAAPAGERGRRLRLGAGAALLALGALATALGAGASPAFVLFGALLLSVARKRSV